MRRYHVLVALALFLGITHARAVAWNSVGHMAVAKTAYEQLTDAEKQRIATLLKSHPHYDRFLSTNRPNGVAEVEWVFLRAATWPDWVRPRGTHDPRDPGVTTFHRANDHFI